ncbi:hypothetical protein V5799_021065 [Amblyomma americanum]|uniref:Puromycin-sensitive aminopeptidase n=1 Tax=Amblyomma americanum TaxID=6943 RepID=A0AAQ4FTR2_AMBAM
MSSSARRVAGSRNATVHDPSNKLFRSIDSDSAQAPVVKHQSWQLACLASCFVISVVIMMGFSAASVAGSPQRAPPPGRQHSSGLARVITWWHLGPATRTKAAAAPATNATVGSFVLPKLRSREDYDDSEPSDRLLPHRRDHFINAILLPTEPASAGMKGLVPQAEPQAQVTERAVDATSGASGVPKASTTRGRRVFLEGSTPVHYVLEVEPGLEEASNFTFNGTVTVTFVCRRRTDKIALHAAASLTVDVLNIVATFRSVQKPLRIDNTSRNVLEDLYLIRLKEQLHRNERYNLTLRFSGTVGTEPKGLYRVSYVDAVTRRPRWVLLTKMRPKYARRVFPCFDDPSVTASFDITIVHKKGLNAVSNMPVYRTERRTSDLVADTFARTPKIPTLLIALTLNDFPSFGKGTMRVWTRASATTLAQKLALDIVPKLLEHYEDYYETKYPMPKLDLLHDKHPLSPIEMCDRGARRWFSDIVILANCSILTAGYFGLIFMKEPTFVLQNPRTTMAKDAVHRLSSLAQAISGQWFGNHVTLSGWNNIWLSRALAGFNKYSALKKIDAYWDAVDLDLVYDVHDAMYLDSLGTHYALSDEDSIETHAENPLVNINLKKVENMSGTPMDLTSVMHSWTRQDGYPLVTVKRFYASGTAKVSQCRYYLNEPRLENRSGALQMSLAFSTSRYLTKEREFLPWKAVLNAWKNIENLLLGTNIFPSWKAFVLRLITSAYTALNWEEKPSDDVQKTLLRNEIYSLACRYDYAPCVSAALNYFKAFKSANRHQNKIPRNQRGFVYCTAVQRGDYSDWKFVWDRFLEHAHEPGYERSELVWALTCSSNQRITRTLLRKTLTEKVFNVHDCVRIFSLVAEHSIEGRNLTLDFIRKNWPSMFFMYELY